MNYSNLLNICWFMKISTIQPDCNRPIDKIDLGELHVHKKITRNFFFLSSFLEGASNPTNLILTRQFFMTLIVLSLFLFLGWPDSNLRFKEETTTKKCWIYHNIKMFWEFYFWILMSHGIVTRAFGRIDLSLEKYFLRNSFADRLTLIKIVNISNM